MIPQSPINIYSLVCHRVYEVKEEQAQIKKLNAEQLAAMENETIAQAVADILDLTRDKLDMSHGGKRRYVLGRHLTWRLMKDAKPFITYTEMMKLFGNGNHTTVLHGLGAVDTRIEQEEWVKDIYIALKKKLGI